jgi:regulatory factor X 1/2/3
MGDASGAIPDFPDIEFPAGLALPEDCTLDDVDTFRSIYREHCEVILFRLMLDISVLKFSSAVMDVFIQ